VHDQPIKTALRGGEVWKINYEIHDSLDRVEPPALLTGELPRLTWRVMLRMVTAENGDIREWEVGVEFGEFGEVLGESWWVGRAGQAGAKRGHSGLPRRLYSIKVAKTFHFQFSLTGCSRIS
jgi:hypothetical protein